MKTSKFLRLLMFAILSIGSISPSLAETVKSTDTGQHHYLSVNIINNLEATDTETLKETIRKLRGG